MTQRPENPGLANNSSWNDSGFAFAPNTNVLDTDSMPSDAAQRAREKSAQVMAALKAGDTERANAIMGKDETKGRILPGMGWVKRKLNGKKDEKVVDDSASTAETLVGSERDVKV